MLHSCSFGTVYCRIRRASATTSLRACASVVHVSVAWNGVAAAAAAAAVEPAKPGQMSIPPWSEEEALQAADFK
jgi:hypothetical protein